MFQPYVLFEDYSHHSCSGKASSQPQRIAPENQPNLSALAEREGYTATLLGYPKSAKAEGLKIIHRVPSIEGYTATLLGYPIVVRRYQKINRKNAPNELSLWSSTKTTQGG